MYLGNKAIKKNHSKGLIIIDPFKDERLQLASYDVAVGQYFWWVDELDTWHLEQHEYVLEPLCSVLACTEEIIGTDANSGLSSQIVSKSTPMRNLLALGDTAGWGDPGFCSRYTFPITNRSKRPVTIKHGDVLAQVVFMRIQNYEGNYSDKGNYMKKEWTPQLMLPKNANSILL